MLDLKSIVEYTKYLYDHNQQPWFDFCLQDDVVKRGKGDVTKKKSAPLFRDCTTFADFAKRVFPEIIKWAIKDPKSFIKIFPQTKDIETFNIGFDRLPDGSCAITVELFPGSYTPREGEDSLKYVKDKSIPKEERVVRFSIELDSDGNAIAFVKPFTRGKEGQEKQILKYPDNKISSRDMFSEIVIEGNGTSMMASPDSLVLLTYFATDYHFPELLFKLAKVHHQLGYPDMILSGMMGRDETFAMDFDLKTDKAFKSSADYIRHCLQTRLKWHHHPVSHILHSIQNAPILSEFDKANALIDPQVLRDRVIELFEFTESTGYIKISLLKSIASSLELLKSDKPFSTEKSLSNSPGARVKLPLSLRELEIIKSMLKATKLHDFLQENTGMDIQNPSANRLLQFEKLPDIFRPSNVPIISPKHMDVLRARYIKINPSTLVTSPKTVAQLRTLR